jgi:hypothetical protein
MPFVLTGNRLYIGGIIGPGGDVQRVVGRLGKDCSVEQGYECARQSALRTLARVREAMGSLDRVVRVVRSSIRRRASPTNRGWPMVFLTCWSKYSVKPAATHVPRLALLPFLVERPSKSNQSSRSLSSQGLCSRERPNG